MTGQSGGVKSTPAEFTLNCWVTGDNPGQAFTVTVFRSNTIAQLKAAIKLGKDPELNSLSADLLELWKVCVLYEEFEGNTAYFAAPGDVQDAERLTRPLRLVGDIFDAESTPAEHVHVIALPPASRVGKHPKHPVELY
jgi:hypothetical protein